MAGIGGITRGGTRAGRRGNTPQRSRGVLDTEETGSSHGLSLEQERGQLLDSTDLREAQRGSALQARGADQAQPALPGVAPTAGMRASSLQPLHNTNQPPSGRKRTKFSTALEDARTAMDPQSRMQVSSLPQDFDGRLFLSEDGMSGYAISRGGELISAFNHPSNPNRGAMDAILTSARAEGASHLHGFNNLAESYTRRGAVETNRYPWDPQEAQGLPEWNTETMGTPDYVRMDIGGVFPEQRASRLSPTEHLPNQRHKPTQPVIDEILSTYATPENIERLGRIMDEGIARGGDRWYHTGGIKDKFIEILGPEVGDDAFWTFSQGVAALSPRSNVSTNLKRASIPYQEYMQGRAVNPGPEAFPPGYGHMAHTTAHQASLDRMATTGRVGDGVTAAKASSFGDNVYGNHRPLTADAHYNELVTGRASSPSAAEYPVLEQIGVDLAESRGLLPAEGQSSLWVGGSEITGVANAQNLTPAMNQRIAATARELGISEEEAMRMFIRGETKLYTNPAAGLGAGAGAGALAAGSLAPTEEAEAGPVGRKIIQEGVRQFNPGDRFVQQSRNDLGRLKRGDDTGANVLEKIGDRIERVQGLGADAITPEQRAAAMDSLWNEYAQAQQLMQDTSMGGPRPEMRQQDSFPGDIPIFEDLAVPDGSSPFENRMYRRDRPYTPEEMADLGEMSMLDHEMRQVPDAFNNPGLAQGRQQVDSFDNFRPDADEGRIWSPEEIAELNAPHPDKQLMGVAGAAGAASFLADDAEDAGVLAEPTMQEDDGRVSARHGMGEELRKRNKLPGILQQIKSDMNMIGDVAEFAGDAVRHTGGLMLGGLVGAANLPTNIYNGIRDGSGLDGAMNASADQVNAVRDLIGHAEMSDDNQIIQWIGSLLQQPQVAQALETLIEKDDEWSDRAEQAGLLPYIAYKTGTRFAIEQPFF